METNGTKRDLQNNFPTQTKPSFNKVRTHGKRYVYLRGTNLALVRGFEGTDDELEALLKSDDVRRMIENHDLRAKSATNGWRMDAAKALHVGCQKRANSYERPYSLSIEMINTMLIEANDRCELTKIQFEYGRRKNSNWTRRPFAPSLDRIDNTKGYTIDNVRLVCLCVNTAINEWGLEIFRKMCQAFIELERSA